MCHVDSPADGISHVTTIRKGVSENYFRQCQNGEWQTHSEDTFLAEVINIGLSISHK